MSKQIKVCGDSPLNNYRTYLQKQGYSISTVASYLIEVQKFTSWCKRQSTTPIEVDYKTSLKYIKYLTRKGNGKKTINHRLCSLKIYFNYLVSQAYRAHNPIENTTVKGAKQTINYNLLDADELEDLYYSYETEGIKDPYHRITAKRGKVITGLIVYQGLNTTDLGRLKIEHLQLAKGKIYVPGSKRSNARELELKPWQIMEFMQYLDEVRPVIQNKLENHSGQLFPTNARFSAIIYHITRKLKRYNAKVQDVKQIRASVITNWLGQYNLRKVQYLAGHRYISSTERYLQDDLENLHEIVNNFHPIQ